MKSVIESWDYGPNNRTLYLCAPPVVIHAAPGAAKVEGGALYRGAWEAIHAVSNTALHPFHDWIESEVI